MMTSQQIGNEALAIYQANKDDQERIDMLLREYFAQVRRDEFMEQMQAVEMEMAR